MKILLVCQHYYPEHFQNQDICEQLVQDGHDVTVLTGLPNYEEGVVRKEYRKGKLRKEKINGVRVFRTFEIGRRKNIFWRVLNYCSYMLSASFWAVRSKYKFDIVFSYQLSPILMMVPAVIVSKKQQIPLYVYCCDLWPESMKAMPLGKNPLLFNFMYWVSRWLYGCADAISVQSKSFFPYFEEVHQIPAKKLSFIPHMASSEYLVMDFRQDNGLIDFVFLGNIGTAQDINLIINATEKNKEMTGFCVHFVGDGSFLLQAQKLVRLKGLEKLIIFHGRKSIECMPDYYKLADVCLVTLKTGSIISRTIPSKVQGYMAAGIPILGALDGYGADVINESGAGVCVAAGNLEAFSQRMRDFILHYENYKDCSIKARNYFRNNFTKRIVVDAIEAKLQKLIEDKRGQNENDA